MTIAIYETVHLECLLPLCDFLWDSKHSVHVFTSTGFKTDLLEILQEKFTCFAWTFLPETAGWKTHYGLLHGFFKTADIDLVLLNSLESRHLLVFAALLPLKNKKVILNLHDVNNFFTARPGGDVKAILRTVSKKTLQKAIHAFAVNAQEMKVYIEKNSFTRKPAFWLPHVITKAQPPTKQLTDLVLTIPGSIDAKRRDYLFALNVVDQLYALQLSPRLVLAGRPVGDYGTTILNRCRQLQAQGKPIVFFEHEIRENAFQALVSESTFLFSPLTICTTIQDNIPEQYGVTKYSGNIYDGLRHGKILLVPSTLAVPKEMESSTVFYQSAEHLVQQLVDLVTDPERLWALQKEAYQNAMKFTRAAYAHRFNALLTVVS